MTALLAAAVAAALTLTPEPAPAAAAGKWTRVRAPSSASCEVLARAAAQPDLPYPYFTTYVLRDTGQRPRASCVDQADRDRDRRRRAAPDGGCRGGARR